MQNDILQITEELVHIKSTFDRPEELQRVVQYAERFFEGVSGLTRKRYERNGKPSVVFSTVDSLTPDILFMGHLDVVPADDAFFDPVRDGDRLLGRGVCDMKSECAAMMIILKEIAAQANPPSIALMLTTDEEIGGHNGAGYLVNEVGYRPKVAIVPDSGQAPDDMVLDNKGVLHLRVTAHGVSAHGSRPWLGDNAIDKLIGAYKNIRTLFPPVDETHDWYDTCNLGTICGGKAINQVPDVSHAELDIRFTETTDPAALLARVKEAASPCDVEIVSDGPMSHTDPAHPSVGVYGEVLKEVLGVEPRHTKSCGAHDGRYLNAFGIPVIVSRPLSGDQHSPREWVNVPSLYQYLDVYRAYVRKLSERSLASEKVLNQVLTAVSK